MVNQSSDVPNHFKPMDTFELLKGDGEHNLKMAAPGDNPQMVVA